MDYDELAAIRSDCEQIIVSNLRMLLDRYERDPLYHFADMKFKVISGEDFPRGSASRGTIYDRDVIYGVIQGRAMEALAGHIAWLPRAITLHADERAALQERSGQMLAQVAAAMEELRSAADGHVYFMMSATDRGPLCVTADARVAAWDVPQNGCTDTELFYSKGLIAAGLCLSDGTLLHEGQGLFRRVSDTVHCGRTLNDRQPMDPKNEVRAIPGRLSHALKMLSLGGAAIGIEAGLGDSYWHLGARHIRDVVAGHVNRGQFSDLTSWDFVEFVDPAGRPWRDGEGRVWCDPGHALEFVGLSLKVILAMRDAATPGPPEILPALGGFAADAFPQMFAHLFGLGFSAERGGICKAYDLSAREPINSDMPWWNLPETIRAAAELMELLPETDTGCPTAAALACHRAYQSHYARRDCALLPIQTRAADGSPVDVIPAFPDADPCYHTGLSLIDTLKLLPQA